MVARLELQDGVQAVRELLRLRGAQNKLSTFLSNIEASSAGGLGFMGGRRVGWVIWRAPTIRRLGKAAFYCSCRCSFT